jgi:hypothetical protein
MNGSANGKTLCLQRARSGRDITVKAESSAEARRTVMEMFPGAVVTGVSRVKR